MGKRGFLNAGQPPRHGSCTSSQFTYAHLINSGVHRQELYNTSGIRDTLTLRRHTKRGRGKGNNTSKMAQLTQTLTCRRLRCTGKTPAPEVRTTTLQIRQTDKRTQNWLAYGMMTEWVSHSFWKTLWNRRTNLRLEMEIELFRYLSVFTNYKQKTAFDGLFGLTDQPCPNVELTEKDNSSRHPIYNLHTKYQPLSIHCKFPAVMTRLTAHL